MPLSPRPQPQGQGQCCQSTWKRFHLSGICRSLQHPVPCPPPPPTPASRGSFSSLHMLTLSTTQWELGGLSLELCISILPSGWEAFSALAQGRLGQSGGCGLIQNGHRWSSPGTVFTVKSEAFGPTGSLGSSWLGCSLLQEGKSHITLQFHPLQRKMSGTRTEQVQSCVPGGRMEEGSGGPRRRGPLPQTQN